MACRLRGEREPLSKAHFHRQHQHHAKPKRARSFSVLFCSLTTSETQRVRTVVSGEFPSAAATAAPKELARFLLLAHDVRETAGDSSSLGNSISGPFPSATASASCEKGRHKRARSFSVLLLAYDVRETAGDSSSLGNSISGPTPSATASAPCEKGRHKRARSFSFARSRRPRHSG
jgi:hypothetical protein